VRFLVQGVVLIALRPELILAQVSQESLNDRTPKVSASSATFIGRLTGPYEAPGVSSVNFQNSQRIFELMRAGQLYLSLEDAIALALENNLDIELQRFVPKIADADSLRARGGGLLRGLSLLVNEPAPGIGGPNGPLLTSLTAGSTPSPLVNTNFSDIALISQQQNDLSITGAIPLASGPPVPQFDPVVSGGVSAQHLTTPEYDPVQTGSNWLSQNTVSANAGLNAGFSPGTQVGVSFDNSRNTTNAAGYTYNPFATSSLGLTITQPLLQGFGASLNKRFILIARNNRKVADLIFRQQVMDTVSGVARLYTDLVSLNEDVKVKEEALRLAQRLYEDNRNQVDQGTQAPIEVTRANAAVSVSRQALIVAQGLVRQQELILKTAITRGGLTNPDVLTAHIVPTDTLTVPDQESGPALPDMLAEALQKRPDLAGASLQVENSEISLKGSLNAVQPQLNLVGTVQNTGMAGDLNPLASTLPASLTLGGYGTALGQVFRRDFPTYEIGLQLNLPLRNRVAQADAVRDELQLKQTQVRRQQFEDQVRLEVADAEESLLQARASYEAAVEARRLQEQSVTVEQQTFDVGLSTNLLMIQYENYLAQAQSTEVAAKGAYVKAKIALQRAIGTILDENHVVIDEAYRGNVARPADPLPKADR
jgi:outer membrane protein